MRNKLKFPLLLLLLLLLCSLKNGNHTPIMFIRLCLMNNASGAKLLEESMSEGRLHTGSDVLPNFFDCQTLISRFDMTVH